MAKHIKTIISLMMTLAMLLVSVPMMSAVAEADPASLIVEDIDTLTKAEAEGRTVFVSDHRADSGNVINGFAFVNNGSSGSHYGNNGNGRKFYIHDYGYGDNRNLEITYRPTTTGEYIVTREGSSGTYTADTYVERYVGDSWGYNGFMYTKTSAVPTLYKDVSAAESGYAVYTIEVLDGSSVDDAYLAVTFIDIDDSWLRSDGVTHRGAIVAGVPLADYYDTEAMGKQTVLVPLSAFDFKDERVFLDCATSNGTRDDYDIYDNYDNYRATKAVQWDGFTGMGIARNDTDAENVESFQYVAYNLAIVGGYEAPVLSVDAASSTLSWTASGYADTTYTITKGDGTTIDAGTATSYVDTAMADGDTYTVTSNVSVTSANTNNVTYAIPATSEAVTVTAGGVVEKEDGTALIIADIDTTNGGDARATNIFVGDHYAQSDSTVHGLTFLNLNSNGSHYNTAGVKDGRQFYIHDTNYDDGADTPKGRAITYRPSAANEYFVTRQSSSLYTADAYVERYVGGTWGFQGYVYSENAAEKKCKDLTSAVDDGYAVFSVEIKDGSSVDDAYFAITFADADAGWWSNSMSAYRGQIVVGVPLADYYDTEAMGKQTVYVPLSAFNVKDERVFVDIATMNTQTSTYTHGLFTDKAAWRAANDVQWDTITGIGWARNDTDGDSSDFFRVIAYNVAFVDGYEAPVLTAAYDAAAGGNVLSWTDSAYEGATYTITKTNGNTTETIDAGTALTYTDTDLTATGYTYTVTANAPATSVMVNTPVYEIPATSNAVEIGDIELPDVAEVDGVGYDTLEEAVEAAQPGATVKLLSDASGNGIVINKDITIDLGGFTYTVAGTPVGSAGTVTQGFQILKDNDVTIKNGKVKTSTDDVKMLVQNYSNLTLKDVTLDGTGSANMLYVLSNNCGNIAITGATNITAPEGAVAFDVYDYSSAGYTVPNVTVSTTGKITGTIEVSDTATLVISSGTYTVALDEAWCAEGMRTVKNSDGTYGVEIIPDVLDASELVVLGVDLSIGSSSTEAGAIVNQMFIGDYNLGSEGLRPTKFQTGYQAYQTITGGKRFWINDTGYEDSLYSKERAITYRPVSSGEYYVTRMSGDGVTEYKADAYVAHYVGHLENGSTAPDSWINDKWGYAGYMTANKVYGDGNYLDLSSEADELYALYTINIPEGMNVDGVYLAITHTDEKYWIKASDGSHYGEVAVGVPLADYYDVNARGVQTVKVPLSDFNFKGTTLDNKKHFVSACYGDEYVLFNAYDQFIKYNNPQWEAFTGLGIVREDLDDATVEGFNFELYDLAVVKDFDNAPVLEAEYVESSGSVALSWTESGYTDTTYVITKTDGITKETIEIADDTMYVDKDVEEGLYKYTVTAKVGEYGLSATSDEISVTVYGSIIEYPEGEVVEKTVEVEKFSFNPSVYDTYLSPTGYYKGAGSVYNDYKTTWNYNTGGKGYQTYITDNNGDETIDDNEQNPKFGRALEDSDVKNWGSTNWAFEGFKIQYWPDGTQETLDKIPDDRWGNVFNIADYMNNGYAVFEVEVGENTTSTDDIYLSLLNVKELWAIQGMTDAYPQEPPVSKETHPGLGGDSYAVSVTGVSLEDYYDVAKGGCQTVAIPLSKFVSGYDFKDMYGKTWGASKYTNTFGVDFVPELFHGMGIVKDDKDPSTVTTSEVFLKNLKIAAVEAPKNLSVTDAKGSAYITWDGTADKDTTYSVVKKIGNEVEYIAVGTDNKYTDSDVLPGATYTYSVVAVHTGTGASLKSPESNAVAYASEGAGNPTEFVDAVTVDYEPNTYGSAISKRYAGYYTGKNNGWNDYESPWTWRNGGYVIKIVDSNGDDEILVDESLNNGRGMGVEINPAIANLAGYGSSDGVKNWGKSTWGYQGFNFGYDWNLADQTTIDAVPDAYWGNVYDLSGNEDSAYIVYELEVADATDTTDGLYLAVESVLSTDYLSGYDSAAGLPVSKINQPKMTSTQAGASGVFGVPLGDYYDFEKGGYQKIVVPVSEFINNPEFADVYGKSGFGLSKYNADEVKFQPALFTGAGLVKDDLAPGALEVTTLEAHLKTLQLAEIEAPAYVVSTLDGVDVALTWPISATTGVTGYEVYRNDELIATVATNYYKDTAATGNLNNTYSIKAVYGDTGMTSKATYAPAVDIPVAAVKLYTGSGSAKKETQYVTDGTMTVSGYSVDAGNTLYAARYNAAGELVEVMPTVLPASAWTDVVFNNVVETDIIKGYIWNTTSFAPVTAPFTFKKLGIKSYDITYPTYGKKAVTFNINDAAATDAAVIELMHRYGINATFGLTGSEEDYSMYVHDDFEIANHTTHIEMYLTDEYEDDNGNTVTPPTYEECVESIETAEAAITSGAGTAPAGMAWPYFAPEERSFYNQLKTYAATNGYDYIRDSQVTGTFDMPIDWLDWGLTGYVQADNTEELLSLADTFRALSSSQFKVMSLAGNGEDMTEEELLSFYESLFAKLATDSIWKATNIEICNYAQACDKLEITEDYIYNPTDVTIYMIVNDQQWIAEPNSYAHNIAEE